MQTLILALPPADPDQPGTPGGTEAPGGSMFWIFMLPILLLVLFMPMFNKKEKHRQKRVSALKKHDRVVTTGGIYGTVVALEDATLTLEIAKDVRVKVKRSSVFDLEKPGDAKEEAQKPAAKPAKSA